MIKKLKIKFISLFMFLVTLMLLIIFGLIFYFTKVNLEKESMQMIKTISLNPRTAPTAPRPGNKTDAVHDIRLPFFILNLSADGTLASVEGDSYDLSDQAYLQELISAVQESAFREGTLSDYQLRFSQSNPPDGTSRIVFVDISGEQHTLTHLLQTCTLIGILCLILFLVISILLSAWAVRPVEQAWEQQHQFVSDASHELKTPLTVILTNAELLQNPSCSPSQQHTFSENILTMAQQMKGLVENLLELARVDNGAMQNTFTAIDFSKLVSEALLPFEPLYYEKGLSLDSTLEDALFVNGNPEYLTQVISILLDNAQKYACYASTVTVSLSHNAHACLFSITNAGETIPPAQLTQIFKRFYRIDQARTMNHSYGLGLAIAKSIVTDHKGKIWCTSENGQITFFVGLPLVLRS